MAGFWLLLAVAGPSIRPVGGILARLVAERRGGIMVMAIAFPLGAGVGLLAVFLELWFR